MNPSKRTELLERALDKIVYKKISHPDIASTFHKSGFGWTESAYYVLKLSMGGIPVNEKLYHAEYVDIKKRLLFVTYKPYVYHKNDH